jgi:GT2 family glycosyltransferase
VVRHPVNRGLAAARNSGIDASRAPLIAFLDDDCEADPRWAERILRAYDDETVAAVGGAVLPGPGDGFTLGYLRRNNPLEPLEIELARSVGRLYRLGLYLRRQWHAPERPARRRVYGLVGANMSFRREVLDEIGRFDERFTFGAEELDAFFHLGRALPERPIVLDADAVVTHHFSPSLRDTLRRSRAYGRGSARFRAKWPAIGIRIFPAPLAAAALVALTGRSRLAALAALALPLAVRPAGIRTAVRARSATPLLDPYVGVAQEALENLGYVEGMARYRRLFPEPSTRADR